ncbi:MAG: phosphatase PAP2 family protein [Lachnospiraceae bacterium]|nr:phosphatase PAP2 family protein [Lachnospiraceae bacterium]
MKNRIQELSGKYRSLLVMCIYAVFYMIAFFYLEQRTGAVHQIHFGIDAYIPFCEVFIIPYLMWFGYVAFTVCFLCVRDQEESEKLVAFLMAGMTIFIVVSAVYPNGHHLRPVVFPRDNVFTRMIAVLYASDTPTNVLPSIHVYNSIAIMIAVWRSKCFKGRRLITGFMLALGVSIIFSTVLIKQHSMIDVLLAFILSGLMYSICYKRAGVREKGAAKYWQ